MQTRRIAWDGIDFEVPANWEFAGYGRHDGLKTLTLEDEYAVRLQAEWQEGGAQTSLRTARKRHVRRMQRLRRNGTTEPVAKLPAEWTAEIYRMADGYALLAALCLDVRGGSWAFFRVHFPPGAVEPPAAVAARLADSFCVHSPGLVAWRLYDLRLDLPAEFRLLAARLQAGRKRLVFERRKRRLHVWLASLASRMTAGRPPAVSVAEFLNVCGDLRGPRFRAEPDGTVVPFRQRRYACGHYDEWTRACFRYHVGWRHDREADQFLIWMLHHRRGRDLRMLQGCFNGYSLAVAPLHGRPAPDSRAAGTDNA